MADTDGTLRLWSTTAANNKPLGSTSIGANLDDNLREIQKVVRQYLASEGSSMASSGTVDLATANGFFIEITGTTTITAFGTEGAGIGYLLYFSGVLTLTHNATSLILPGGANITTAAGDMMWIISEGSGNWRCAFYQPVSKIDRIAVNAQSGTYTVLATDLGKTINCTGTFTLNLTAAATMGAGWWCWVKNVSTGTITIDPASTETISIPGGPETAGTTFTLPYSAALEGPYNVSGVLLWCDGSNWEILSTNEAHGSQEFLAGGTWTAPAGVTAAWVHASGGGGGGGSATRNACGGATGASGGGAGDAVTGVKVTPVPGTAYTVTIGAGGAAVSAGGTTSLGALVSVTGGNAGASAADSASVNGAANNGRGGGGESANNASSGKGGSGPFGGGGRGFGNAADQAGNTAGANSGAGGGGAYRLNVGTQTGGSGGSGYLRVEW